MRTAARSAPAAAATPAVPASAFAVQRCSCGSGEKDGECEECRREAVQTSPAAGSSPPASDAPAPGGHSLAGLRIFPPEPEAEATAGPAVQRAAEVGPPPAREDTEEPQEESAGRGPAPESAAEEGDAGQAVADVESGAPFGGSGGGPAAEAEAGEREEAVQTFSPAAVASRGAPAGPHGGRSVDARAVGRRLAGGGRPLPRSLRRPMERFFGRELGGVRLHADDRTGRLARALSAEAFTVGEHVAFAPGAWRPAEADGRALLAHELRHVLQQRTGLSGEIVRRGIGRSGDTWEREAEAAADDFSRREAREGGAPAEPGDAGAETADAAWEAPLPSAGPGTPGPAVPAAGAGGAGSALQLYSASSAAAYARRWALSANSAYGEFDNDCTNFVSQCLEAGGWQMVAGCDRCGARTSNTVWWFQRDGCTRIFFSNVHASHTWGGAENLWQFLKASGRGSLQGRVWDLGVGDVLQFDNNGNQHIRHTMMVTRKTADNLYLSYHSSPHLDEPFYPEGDNSGVLARNPSPPKNYFAWKITGDTGPTHDCTPRCTPQSLGGGLYLREDCTTYLGPGPKF